jgi:hypothetical protein
MSNNIAKPPNNGAILTFAQIIKAVMSLAAKAEVGHLYINCREAIPTRHTLEFMGHPQPPTPLQTDNTTALGAVNNNVIKKLKAMDIKYHRLHNGERQGQFQHYWAPDKEKNGNYVTKHHAAIHHQATCPTFLPNISTLQALHQQLTGNLPVARVCWIYTTLQHGIIYIPTVSHIMSHLGPLFILGQTRIDRATTFSLSQESNP